MSPGTSAGSTTSSSTPWRPPTRRSQDAGWTPQDEDERERTGVIIGSGIGGLATIADTAIELHEKGPRRVSPFFIPSALINLASGQVSIRYGFKGPNHAVVTACATGAHAVGDAVAADPVRRRRRDGRRRRGGGGVPDRHRRLHRLPRHVDQLQRRRRTKASRPYDKDRDGFVMGEGAGALVLEE